MEEKDMIESLVEVLRFYADEENYYQIKRHPGDPASPVDCDILEDNGKRARDVIMRLLERR